MTVATGVHSPRAPGLTSLFETVVIEISMIALSLLDFDAVYYIGTSSKFI